MRVQWVQHAVEEDLGCIAPWLAARGHAATRTRFVDGDAAPALASFDVLIVMGGAMNVDEEARHPWLADEKRFLRTAIDAGKPVLGICLGGQLIADVLGARVSRNRERELGWFDVTLTAEGRASRALADWPGRAALFHWHGDRFELPQGATRLAASEGCDEQGFELDGGRVIGLQFHPEVTAANVREWIAHEAPGDGRYVQTGDEMLRDLERFAEANRLMHALLVRWIG